MEAGVSAEYGRDVEAMRLAETASLDSQAKENWNKPAKLDTE